MGLLCELGVMPRVADFALAAPHKLTELALGHPRRTHPPIEQCTASWYDSALQSSPTHVRCIAAQSQAGMGALAFDGRVAIGDR